MVKTRLQLQGELDPSAPKPYKGVVDAFRKIWKTEGILGIQAGLGPGYAFQVAMNGTRLGTFTVLKSFMGNPEDTSFFFIKNVAAGATAGVFAACLGSPFYLVKTRLQAQAGSKLLAVGHQYHYTCDLRARLLRSLLTPHLGACLTRSAPSYAPRVSWA